MKESNSKIEEEKKKLRTRFSEEVKMQITAEVNLEGNNTKVALRYNIDEGTVRKWKKKYGDKNEINKKKLKTDPKEGKYKELEKQLFE